MMYFNKSLKKYESKIILLVINYYGFNKFQIKNTTNQFFKTDDILPPPFFFSSTNDPIFSRHFQIGYGNPAKNLQLSRCISS